MDLWRLWIRRQHSVWQVMREEGLAIRRKSRRGPWAIAAAAAVVVLAAGLLAMRPWRRAPEVASPLALGATRGLLVLDVRPDDAVLRMDGRRVGIGDLRDEVASGDHVLELTATGFADTSIRARVVTDDTLSLGVELRPLLGDLRVETTPPGADVRVDGRAAGKSPITVRGLGVVASHRVDASLAGFGAAHAEVAVTAGATATTSLRLEMGKTDVLVTTEPGGGEIKVDGVARGVTPLTVAALPHGRHVIRAQRDGYDAAETTLVVTDATRQLHLALVREAPGVLVVLGDLPAQIYVDGTLVVENVQNSGPRSLPPGNHAVRVILVSGETIDHTVGVRSGERSTYDFSRNVVTRNSGGNR